MSQLVELPQTGFYPHNYVWFHQNLGGCNRTGRVSRYLADLVLMTEVCPVTYTENLSNIWTTADYPLRRLVSHVRGVPPRGPCLHVLHIPSGRTWKDLGTDYGVYFFVTEWPPRELRMTFYKRLCPGYSCFVQRPGTTVKA